MNTDSGAEFYVRDVLNDDAGDIVVVGIPNNGIPVKVGDRFELRYKVDRDDILAGVQNPNRKDCAIVGLSVVRIDFMRKSVTELPHGATGGLYLSGDGLNGVTPGCFLQTSGGRGKTGVSVNFSR